MLGQVIEIDYQLYVKFENGVIAILQDFYCNNCVGVWRDFEYNDADPTVDGYRVWNSRTAPYSTKDKVRQFR